MFNTPPNGGVWCNTVPDPATSAGFYFQLLNIPPAFEIDLAALENAYFKAQRVYHPDRFIGKPPEERMRALQISADINQAYETLKNPLKRAQYLLKLENIIVGTEADSIKPTQALLLEIMELREDGVAQEKLTAMIATSTANIAAYYADKKFTEMAQETIRLGYLEKIKLDSRLRGNDKV